MAHHNCPKECKKQDAVYLKPHKHRPKDGCSETATLWIDKEGDLMLSNKGKTHEIAMKDDPKSIEGWWLNTTKGAIYDTTVLWHIYRKGDELRAHLYAGYPGRYREWTKEDFEQVDIGMFWGLTETTPTVNDILLEPDYGWNSDPNICKDKDKKCHDKHKEIRSYLFNPSQFNDPQYLSSQQRTARLNRTDDPNVLWAYSFDMGDNVSIDGLGDIIRLHRIEKPPIESYTPGFIDNTNPVKIFENVFNMLILNGNPQFNHQVQNGQPKPYPGYGALLERKQKLLTTGMSYGPFTIKDVWRSRTDQPTQFPFPISTTLVTHEFSYPRIAARAVVTGFKGDYVILNNENGWEMGIADNQNGVDTKTSLRPDFYDGANQKNLLTIIDIDTSGLPEYNPAIHGQGCVKVIVDPVTPASEYRQLVAALYDLHSYDMRMTHCYPVVWIDSETYRIYHTFAEIQKGIDDGKAIMKRLRSRAYYVTRSGGVYNDFFYNTDFYTTPAIPSNDPTGININDENFLYNIVAGNYLDPERNYAIYWRLDGPSRKCSPITTQRLVEMTDGYYAEPGSKFVYEIRNLFDEPPDPAVWHVYGDLATELTFGIIHPSLSQGKTMAYISLLDVLGPDPAYNASFFKDFTQKGDLYPVGPIGDCFAAVMTKLNESNPDVYIIDNSPNSGGWPSIYYAISAFFGNNRTQFSSYFVSSDNGNGPAYNIQHIQDVAQFKNLQSTIDQQSIINTDYFAEKYPAAMVRRPVKVIFLNSTNASSGGDMSPHYFRNADSDDYGDLGSGVKSYIVGDSDGRLFGTGTHHINLFTNESNNLKQNGVAVSAVRERLEIWENTYRLGKYGYFLDIQPDVIKPDLLHNFDIENNLWQDVGSIGPYPLNPVDGGNDKYVLPLSTGVGQPVYEDPTTWRDKSLEKCIQYALELFNDDAKLVKDKNTQIVKPRRNKKELLTFFKNRHHQYIPSFNKSNHHLRIHKLK
jgi:hypothetical protein